MAWQKTLMTNDYGSPLWYDPQTGNYTDIDPASTQMSGPVGIRYSNDGEGGGGALPYYVNQAGVALADQGAGYKALEKQRDDEFNAVLRDPNSSSFQKMQAVEKRYGIEAVAQLTSQGYFSDVPNSGEYIAARQREGEAEGMSIGGNQLGLWPVILAMMGAGAYNAIAGGSTAGAGAGAGAGASEGVAATGFESIGMGAAPTGAGAATGGGSLAAGSSALPAAGAGAAVAGGSILGDGAAAGSTAGAGGGGTAAGGAVGAGTAAGSSILSNPSLIGAGLGAAASIFGGGNKPAGTTTTVEDIPEWLKPYANQGMAGLSSAFQASPGGVNPLTAKGGGYLSDVIGGDYLNSNPYLDAMFGRAAGKVSSGVNSQFSGAGRYGSGAHQGVLGESLGNLATDIYGGNYTRERANQQAAALASGSFGNTMINQPFLPGQNLLSGVNSIKGGSKSTPYFENQLADILSGAMGGAMLGKSFA